MAGPVFVLQGRRWWWTLPLRLVLALGLWSLLPLAWWAAVQAGAVVASVPPPDPLALQPVRHEVPTRVLSAEGFVIGGLERGTRPWVPIEEVSPWLVLAILAGEDARFYTHGGVDPRGVLRAALANRRAGRVVQGGSTLTQQVAKMLVGDERSMARKLQEAVTARMLERRHSKAEILEAWVNRIYWGQGATGIGAAAELYFGTTPDRLTPAQSALLVAMVPAPARWDPFRRPEEARVRRDRILDRMEALGFLDGPALQASLRAPLGLRTGRARRVEAPGVTRMALRQWQTLHPDQDWRWGGWVMHTTVSMMRQRQAQDAALRHALALDRRQGWRGAPAWAPDPDAPAFQAGLADACAQLGDAPWVRPAVVRAVGPREVEVETCGPVQVAVGPEGWAWAVPWREDARNHGDTLQHPEGTFRVGDVVGLSRDGLLTQRPRIEAAVGVLDLADGSLRASVGALDARRSEFDRWWDACRQPGSTFKPIVYSAAFDRRWTAATILRDAPERWELGPQEQWTPRNADGRFAGHMTLHQAFVLSRNLPVLEVYQGTGWRAVAARARALGIESPQEAVESLALGASCLHPVELVRAYATFARGGWRPVVHLVDRVEVADRPDRLRLWPREDPPMSAGWSTRARVQAMWALLESRRRPPAPALNPQNAWWTAWLLRQAVLRGTGGPARALPMPVAGKTGTTTAYDAWFAGFSAAEAAVVWVGTDRNTRPLGRGESGGHLALPLWMEVLRPLDPQLPLLGPLPSGMHMVAIDPATGLRAPSGGIEMPFLDRTEPGEFAPTREERRLERMDRTLREF
jgi:penicillin-binding protein 1A